MDGINKYSREWFALNGNSEYIEKAESLKDGVENTNGSENFKLDGSLFIGDKETVIDNIADYYESPTEKKEAINAVKAYGAENIFEVLDANSDGVITEEELADMAGTSTLQSDEKIDTIFTVRDFRNYYKNAMAAEGAIVEEDGNTIKITYSDGKYTELKTDENGNVYSRYYEQVYNDGRLGVEYNSKDGLKTQTYFDSQHRPTTEIVYKDNKIYQSTTYYTYNEDGSKKVEAETIGKNLLTEYDENGNIVSQNLEFKYNSDGIIDDTKQQEGMGTCWLLSGINALRATEKGAEIIKNSLQQNEDGSVTVYLNGVNKSYTYTPEDIVSYIEEKSSTGDDDMDILSMAISDFRYEKILNGLNDVNNRFDTALKDATLEDPLNGGYLDEAIYYLTGINSKFKFAANTQEEKIELINEYLKGDKSNIAATIAFNDVDKSVDEGIITNHAYSIVGADEENVYVENPWNSGKTIAYPIEKIGKNTLRISLTYLSEEDNAQANTSKNENVFAKLGDIFDEIGNKISNLFNNLF